LSESGVEGAELGGILAISFWNYYNVKAEISSERAHILALLHTADKTSSMAFWFSALAML
jgi:hypothetical protein